MRLVRTIADMQALAREWQTAGLAVGLVPTMGYLHEGHLSLVRLARGRGDIVVVSIFVNPTQFGPGEDLSCYPRDAERDERLCREAGTDAIFWPSPEEMYPSDFSTWVEEGSLSQPLCGRSRPGHFRGVCTVVTKLLNAVCPTFAVFGRKDAQQASVIRRMVRDLNVPVDIVVAPTVRESDGLAMSSRNQYLSPEERRRALSLSRGLRLAQDAFARGERRSETLQRLATEQIEAAGGRIDYVELVAESDFRPLAQVDEPAVLAVAARVGGTRLIDNCGLTPRQED